MSMLLKFITFTCRSLKSFPVNNYMDKSLSIVFAALFIARASSFCYVVELSLFYMIIIIFITLLYLNTKVYFINAFLCVIRKIFS